MTDLTPIIMARVSGTIGDPEATGRVRRIEPEESLEYGASLLAWMGLESVLVRAADDPFALVLPPSSLVGRGPTGSVRALTAADLDTLLGLSTLIAGRSPVGHTHTVGQIQNLQFIINNLSRLGHTHPVGELDSEGVALGYVPTKTAGGVAWAAPSGGGGGTLAGPLVGDILLSGFRVLGATAATEIFRVTGNRLICQGGRLPILNEGTPANLHVWLFNGTSWVHRGLIANDITATPLTGIPGTTVHAQLSELLAAIEARAPLSHTHALSALEVPGGATNGQVVMVNGGQFIVANAPGGGGGVSNPLTSNLNISTYALVSGATEILKFAGGQVYLGGRAVFPAAVTAPLTGQTAIYNEATQLFENGFLQAGRVGMLAISGLASSNVQAALADLKTQLTAATLATTDNLPQGATNKYATGSSVAAAGAVMVANISDDGALGSSTTTVVSQRAIKEYVDTEIAGAGGGGFPAGVTFPGTPSGDDLYLRTDLVEMFIYDAGEDAWVGLSERSVTFELEDFAGADTAGTMTGPGAYLFGNGNTLGYRLPWDAYITGAAVQSTIVDDGIVEIRRAPFGGSVSTALELEFDADSGVTLTEQLVEADAGDLLSVHARSFVDGIIGATATIFYRRRFAA